MAARTAAVIPATRAHVRGTAQTSRRTARTIVFVLIPVGLLLVVGLGAILSASSVIAIREGVDNLYYFKRQLVWMGVGQLVMVGAAHTPPRVLRRMAFPLFVGSVILLKYRTRLLTEIGCWSVCAVYLVLAAIWWKFYFAYF